ncbi:hypothetical protein SDJN03_21707, partial [Cucurbita argyrosperma subsp. sororia]
MKDEADSAFEIYAEIILTDSRNQFSSSTLLPSRFLTHFQVFTASLDTYNAVSCASTEFEIKLSHSNQLVRIIMASFMNVKMWLDLLQKSLLCSRRWQKKQE